MTSLPQPPSLGVPRRILLGLPLWWVAFRGTSGQSAAASDGSQSPHRKAIERGVDWLLAQQATDGGWHSSVYGQMRCGVGNTALALYALVQLPKATVDRFRRQIDRGFKFLLSNLDESGFVRNPDGESDYPTYATSLGLTAARRLNLRDHDRLLERMRKYLIAAQQTADRGWPPSRADLGGWNTTEPVPAAPEARDGTSVSIMRFAIEAITASGPLPDETRLAALGYLSRCQNLATGGDGGFFFTPQHGDPLNKAGWAQAQGAPRAVSYGTPTADGLWILASCGISSDDRRRESALRWLREHSQLDFVPGIVDTESAEAAMRDGLKFYYWAALAGLGDIFSVEEFQPLSEKLSDLLVTMQKPDGSWQNSDNSMREDDPLVATSWGLAALGRLAGDGSS